MVACAVVVYRPGGSGGESALILSQQTKGCGMGGGGGGGLC